MLPRCVRRNSSPATNIGTPAAEQQDRGEVLDLPLAQPLDLGIVGRPLDAAVPAVVVVGAVAVALAVGLVVLLVVADEVVEREAVVAGDEVDAVGGHLAGRPEQVAAARRCGWRAVRDEAGSPLTNLRTSSRKRPFHSDQRSPGNRPTSYRPPASHASAIIFVSHRTRDSSMFQSTGGTDISAPSGPRDRTEPRSKRKPSTCCSVDPVLQAFDDVLGDDRVVGVERVTAPGEVHVVLGVGGREHVVGLVGLTPEADGGPVLVALAGVVEHDVEDHLDAGRCSALTMSRNSSRWVPRCGETQ